MKLIRSHSHFLVVSAGNSAMFPITVVSEPLAPTCEPAVPNSVGTTTTTALPTTELRARAASIRVKRHYDNDQLIRRASEYAQVCAETHKELDALRTPSLSPSSSSSTLSSGGGSVSSTLATLDSSQDVQQWRADDFVKSLLEFFETAERPAPIVVPTPFSTAIPFTSLRTYSTTTNANRPYSLKPPPALRRNFTTSSPSPMPGSSTLGSSSRQLPELRARLHTLCTELEDITVTVASLLAPSLSSSSPLKTPTKAPTSEENRSQPGNLSLLASALGLSQSSNPFVFSLAPAGTPSNPGISFTEALRQSQSALRAPQPSSSPSPGANTTFSSSLFSHIGSTSQQIVSPTPSRTQPAEAPTPPFLSPTSAGLHQDPLFSSTPSSSSLPALCPQTDRSFGADFSTRPKLKSSPAEQPIRFVFGANQHSLCSTAPAASSHAPNRKQLKPFNSERNSEHATVGLSKAGPFGEPERASTSSTRHPTSFHPLGSSRVTIRPLIDINPDRLLEALGIQLSPSDLSVVVSFQSIVDLLPWNTTTVEAANPWSTALEVSVVPQRVEFAHTPLLQLPRFAAKLKSRIPFVAHEELARVRISAMTGRKRPRLLLDVAGVESGDVVLRERPLLMCPRRMLLGHLHNLDVVLGEKFSAHKEPLRTLLLSVGGAAAAAANGTIPAHGAFPIVSALRTCGLAVDLVDLGEPLVALFARISLAQHACDDVNCVFEWDSSTCTAVLRATKKIFRDDPIIISFVDYTSLPAVRHAEVQRRFNFDCSCTRCKAPTPITADTALTSTW